jgi:tetratricopeptide (TPR) repeat protein
VRLEIPIGSYVPVARWPTPPEEKPEAGTAAALPPPVVDDWPSVVVSLFEAPPGSGLDADAADLKDELCAEIGRYGDVRVVLQRQMEERGLSTIEGPCYVLSGRLARGDAGLRVSTRLLECRTGRQVWTEEYRSGPGGTGAFYAETARVIAARVASEYGVIAQGLWVEQRKHSPARVTPYGGILRSYRFLAHRDPADFAPAVAALQQVVAEEPECALAWAQLSRLLSVNHAFEVVPDPAPIAPAVTCAQNAVRLDPSSQRARAVLAFALLLKDELAASRAEAQAALDLNPDSLVYLEVVGFLLSLVGDWERGPALLRRALHRNPYVIPVVYLGLWADHLRRGEFDAAHRAALDYRDPGFFRRALMRACSLGHLGRPSEAEAEVAELLRRKPDFEGRGRTLIGRLIKLPDLIERVVAGLENAGLRLA